MGGWWSGWMDTVLRAAGMFAVTNIDDLLILALFFGRAGARRGALRVVAGQYLGFGAILAVAVLGALGAGLLPEPVLPYLGLIPLLLGLRAAWQLWRERGGDGDRPDVGAVGLLHVAAVTFANGGDNIGVYVPVFARSDDLAVYAAVFLAGVAVWCAASWYLAGRPVVAAALARWGHLLLPVALIAIGLFVLFG